MSATILEQLKTGTARLSAFDLPRLEASVLLAHVLGVTKTHLIAYPEQQLTPLQQQRYAARIKRRCKGEPIAYLIGKKAFWSLNIQVDHNTLIPRPETELLVARARLCYLGPYADMHVLELGTGSAAIALALATECPKWSITATDISSRALDVARANAKRLGIASVRFLKSNWFSHVRNRHYDLIVSNPPYLSEKDWLLRDEQLCYEPKHALVCKQQGFAALYHIIKTARFYLKPQACLLLEHGYRQSQKVQDQLKDKGYGRIKTFKDMAGHPRITKAAWLG